MRILDDLASSRDRTLGYFDLPESRLGLTYAPGKWTVRQLLCHLADAETVLYERIRRAICEPRPVVWAFDQDSWVAGLDYTSFPLSINRAIFAAVRGGVIHLASRDYDRIGSREFVHSETGVRTLRDEFDKVAAHNLHHLAQIELALKAG